MSYNANMSLLSFRALICRRYRRYQIKCICINRKNSDQNFQVFVLVPAKQYPLEYYQDWCWNSLPRFLILPQVFHFCHPRLLFQTRFYIFATLGYFFALIFSLLATFPTIYSILKSAPLGFLFRPRFFHFAIPSLFPTQGYLSALGFAL